MDKSEKEFHATDATHVASGDGYRLPLYSEIVLDARSLTELSVQQAPPPRVVSVSLEEVALQKPPPTYLVWSICNTIFGFLFCFICVCWPIAALINSRDTHRHNMANRFHRSIWTSRSAKLFNTVATILIVFGAIIEILVLFIFS